MAGSDSADQARGAADIDQRMMGVTLPDSPMGNNLLMSQHIISIIGIMMDCLQQMRVRIAVVEEEGHCCTGAAPGGKVADKRQWAGDWVQADCEQMSETLFPAGD